MRLHRFYVGDNVKLTHNFWLREPSLLHQWRKVFRLSAGAEVVLFDGQSHDRMYQIVRLERDGAQLSHVTDLAQQIPKKDIYLFWSLLKKDKNEWVLQKCTELGVSHFVPLLTQRTQKIGFNLDRAQKIIIEAAEQCGRSDIPSVREPMLASTALGDYSEKVSLAVCEQGTGASFKHKQERQLGVLIGPEGGWSDKERALFKEHKLPHLDLGQFTLRAETAAVTSIAKLLQ